MTFSSIQNGFVSGEMSPSLFGRTDLAKYHNGCSTLRNFFVNYQGGASSRAGLAYVGTCKQGGSSYPPRDIRFQFNINQGFALEFGEHYMRIKSNGAYVVEATKNITGVTNANPGVVTSASHGYSNGDWVYITGVGGVTQLDGLIWVVANATTNTFTLIDMFGNAENTTSFPVYTSGGTVARIYTVVSPYAAVDLQYLKFTQSANIMSLTCVNQDTGTEYPPYDLRRITNTNWTFTQTTYGASITPPTNVASSAQSSTTIDTWYSYVVTSVDASGQESVASSATNVHNNNISVFAGSNTVTWTGVTGATSYNIYQATPVYSTGGTSPIAVGISYGYVGTSFGASFTDTNITADFTKVPPTHNDPFARGAITGVVVTAGGSGYTQATIGYTITTGTGTGFSGTPLVVGGSFVGFYIINQGSGYLPGDTIAITGGAGATATLTVGNETGTYPGVVAYFQQRRGYANTLQEPDTYFFSKPGLYTNMDYSIPASADDAITGTPWAQQINGIQWMIPMPNGLVVLTGNGGWILSGVNGGAFTAISQQAVQQANVGCSALVTPILINADILYVQSKNSVVRDLAYNFFTNIYVGEDKTILANHLFFNHTITQWAYSEEPYKVLWAVRDDGILLSLTWIKEQDIWGWARHDTDGIVVSICVVTEPPVDAVYAIVKRYINGQWLYYSERMNNRLWQTVEDSFCVDSGLSYPMNYPNATLTPAAANGTNNISATNVIIGGSGYTSPTAIAIDPSGSGSGATFSVTLSGGVITAINVITQGQNYTPGAAYISISDTTGSGAHVDPVITNIIVFNASASVFSSGNVGDIIRVGGGKATVTSYVSGTQVRADVTQPITQVIQDNPNNMPVPAVSGDWSITTPTLTVSGLNHLNGQTIAILADGSVVANQVVTNNSITLQHPATAITVGLPYTCQLQTMYLDPPGQPVTVQGKRKNIYNAVIRVENTRGIAVGSNQPDASTQPNGANVPWENMVEIKQRNALANAGSAIPLFTGDEYINIPADWDVHGQLAIQQNYPLPANVLACITNWQIGDSSG